MLLIGGVAHPAAAQDAPPWDPWDHAELCTQTAQDTGLSLGHMRLVLEDRYYERRTPYGDERIPGLDGCDQAVRNRKCRAFMHALPPMLRIPLANRESWGLAMRGDRPDRQRHPDGTEYWPFHCAPLPLSEPQLRSLTETFEDHFQERDQSRKDEQLDHEFHFRNNNCTTWLLDRVVAALRAQPSGAAWEEALIQALDGASTPTMVRKRMERWAESMERDGVAVGEGAHADH